MLGGTVWDTGVQFKDAVCVATRLAVHRCSAPNTPQPAPLTRLLLPKGSEEEDALQEEEEEARRLQSVALSGLGLASSLTDLYEKLSQRFH